MALTVEDHGSGNQLDIALADQAGLHGRVVFTGHGARVAIGPRCVDAGMRIEAGSGAQVQIGGGNHLGALFIHAVADAVVLLGDEMGVNGAVRIMLHEKALVSIGSGSLIASDVDIIASDMHPIFDAASGLRINPAADIEIGERVWIGARSLVLKGTRIGHDAVVGAGSVVTGMIPAQCVVAGNPARVVRTGVRWAMDL